MSINIGDLLRQTREEKNMTIEQVSEETKIQKRYLEALEEERYEELPGEVHVKGFMRNYCKAIGLDPNEIVDIYKVQKNEKRIPEKKELPEKTKKNLSKLIILIIVVVLIVFIALKVLPNDSENTNEVVNENKTVEHSMDQTLEKAKEEEKSTENLTDSNKEKVIEESIVKIANEEKKSEKTSEEALVETNKEQQEEEKLVETEVVIAEEVNYSKEIKIIVDGKSWMEIKKNGEVILSGIIENNEKLYTGNDSDNFEMKIGNAGSVKIIYNDDDLGILGKPRQVIRRKF